MKTLLLACALLAVQDFGSLEGPPQRSHQFVTYVAAQQTVQARQHAVVELTFRVDPGYHINSHKPKSELLIPTRIELQPTPAVKAEAPEYPAGQPYAFAFDPNEKLDVYADTFKVKVPVTAVTAGAYTVHGTLRYQACDKAACYPPKSLPVDILINATAPAK